MTDAYDAGELAALERRLDEWLADLAAEHDHILAAGRSTDGDARWYVRLRGEEKSSPPSGSRSASARCSTRPT